MNFRERLKELRNQTKYTQKDISKMLNITPTGYASWEQGISEPSIDNIKKLCEIFHVSSDYLIGLED